MHDTSAIGPTSNRATSLHSVGEKFQFHSLTCDALSPSRIRQLSPDSKIIILGQNTDDDLMAAALQAGASTYVVKSEMTADLIPAIQAAQRTRH